LLTDIHFYHTSLIYSYNEKRVRQKFYRKSDAHFMFTNCFSENRDIYDIIRKNVIETVQATDDNLAHAHCMMDT
jgi:hypothetical protein